MIFCRFKGILEEFFRESFIFFATKSSKPFQENLLIDEGPKKRTGMARGGRGARGGGRGGPRGRGRGRGRGGPRGGGPRR